MSASIAYFTSFGFDQRRAEETAKNANLSKTFTALLNEAEKVAKPDLIKEVVNVLYSLASSCPNEVAPHATVLAKYVLDKKIHKTNVSHATAFLKKYGISGKLDIPTFEKETGVGVSVSKDDIKKAVSAEIEKVQKQVVEERYNYPLPALLGNLRQSLKFADPKDIKDEFDAQIAALLGPKTAADNAKPKKKEVKVEAKKEEVAPEKVLTVHFPDPKENIQKFPGLLESHLKETNGVVVCRFPPEPNGFLHLGHAKSMNLNFNYPKKSGGFTYLRFDDTNPEAEKQEYIDSIIGDVKWMGHTPKAVTYSSDYFPQLYAWAVQLIKEDKAYVCHQTGDEIAEYREKKMDSPWRNRPIEESLKLFEDMRKGKFEEGKATLRLKMNMQSDNTVMRDLIAYRIKYTEHPHAGDKWCIYPSYDYTHCLIDSLENITHSLCTLEFEVRRESYYWLIDALRIYRPVVWEYSRLNVSNTVLSKRKLIKLVKDGIVRGWDDPRMPTIGGFRRRGYTPEAINEFCDRIGVTRNENLISHNLLEQCVREDLDERASRAMVVLNPLKVTITNWTGEAVRSIKVPNHPKDPSKGEHTVPISSVIYIDHTDFREEDQKGYKRLAPGKTVGLIHASYHLKYKSHVSKDGKVVELFCEIDFEPKSTAGGYVHWVSEPSPGKSPLSVEVRLYDVLFKSAEPGNLENWLSDLNPKSLEIVKGCYADLWLSSQPVGTRFQFERVGYFVVDPDSTPSNLVFNRIVSLKETKWEDTK